MEGKTYIPQKHYSNKRDAYFPNNYVSYGYFIAVSQYSITLAAKVEQIWEISKHCLTP
jgi:hypothetical protein